MISLNNIVKHYKQQGSPSLGPLSLDIHQGEVLSIMGPSGAGKSTLFNIIGLLDNPTQGEYWLEDRNTTDLTAKQAAHLRNQYFGFVFQFFHLLPYRSVIDNIALPLRYRGVAQKKAEQQANDLLKRFSLEHLSLRSARALSGGEKQRVAIARALITHPKIILADEPTGALDENNANDIMRLLLEVNRKENTTLLIVTHDIRIAAQCQRQIRL